MTPMRDVPCVEPLLMEKGKPSAEGAKAQLLFFTRLLLCAFYLELDLPTCFAIAEDPLENNSIADIPLDLEYS